MCCLFGLYDYGGTLSAKQKNRMIAALAAASEVRGIDATGIAYCMNGHLSVYKRPLPAHWMRFRIPEQAAFRLHAADINPAQRHQLPQPIGLDARQLYEFRPRQRGGTRRQR